MMVAIERSDLQNVFLSRRDVCEWLCQVIPDSMTVGSQLNRFTQMAKRLHYIQSSACHNSERIVGVGL